MYERDDTKQWIVIERLLYLNVTDALWLHAVCVINHVCIYLLNTFIGKSGGRRQWGIVHKSNISVIHIIENTNIGSIVVESSLCQLSKCIHTFAFPPKCRTLWAMRVHYANCTYLCIKWKCLCVSFAPCVSPAHWKTKASNQMREWIDYISYCLSNTTHKFHTQMPIHMRPCHRSFVHIVSMSKSKCGSFCVDGILSKRYEWWCIRWRCHAIISLEIKHVNQGFMWLLDWNGTNIAVIVNGMCGRVMAILHNIFLVVLCVCVKHISPPKMSHVYNNRLLLWFNENGDISNIQTK